MEDRDDPDAAPKRRKRLLLLGLLAAIGATATLAQLRQGTTQEPGRRGLASFRTEAELRIFLRRLQQQQARAELPAYDVAEAPVSVPMSLNVAAQEPMPAAASGITNNQEAGVDEGGIVKRSGDILVILRRGRLFTVSTAGGGLRPIDSIDAFPPGVQAIDDWYDEMLLSGDRIAVVGYSYARGGTEINRFRLDRSGHLRFEDAHHLRSNDYYSSRNYASRLIGTRLVYYTPFSLSSSGDPLDSLPAVRRWRGGGSEQAFRRIAAPSQIFVPPLLRGRASEAIDTLHSVVTCDLAAADLGCSAVGVLGPSSRTFYVSGEAVYLWIAGGWSGERRRHGPPASVYRLPFSGEAPSAIGARGAPVDQFSFREDRADGVLNVLVRAEGGGDAMWAPEVTEGSVALLRVPLGAFGDGSREVPRAHYRPLPHPRGEGWNFHNRFVGDHVLYGAGAFGEARPGALLVAAPVRGGPVAELELPHSVERIEVLGRDALAVGSGPAGSLGFSAVELAGRAPRLGNRYIHPAASEGETRSHAFFYRSDPDSPDGASGMLGLPIARPAGPAYHRFFGSAAAMLFLRREARRFAPAGELAARLEGVEDDGCRASCVDWYGNARPIFLGPRTFALLGYELVEGRLEGGRIREIGRISFAPRR